MERQGFVVSLKKWRDGGWTATFRRDVMLSSDGFGSGSTPWRAVQQAAWQVVKRAPEPAAPGGDQLRRDREGASSRAGVAWLHTPPRLNSQGITA